MPAIQTNTLLMQFTETYLKGQQSAKFDRDDFDSLSGKFLSKLVIRAN
jgi:hypothetical protein